MSIAFCLLSSVIIHLCFLYFLFAFLLIGVTGLLEQSWIKHINKHWWEDGNNGYLDLRWRKEETCHEVAARGDAVPFEALKRLSLPYLTCEGGASRWRPTGMDGKGVTTKRERRLHLATDLPASNLFSLLLNHSFQDSTWLPSGTSAMICSFYFSLLLLPFLSCLIVILSASPATKGIAHCFTQIS